MFKKPMSIVLKCWSEIMAMLHGDLVHRSELNLQVENFKNQVGEIYRHLEIRFDFIQDILREHISLDKSEINGFDHSLRHELIKDLLNEFADNFDPFCGASKEYIQDKTNSDLNYYRNNFDDRVSSLIDKLPVIELRKLYFQLTDNESKRLLTKLMAYRLLGLTKVRLRSASDVQTDREFCDNLTNLISTKSPQYYSGSFEVNCYDLHPIGLNFRCYTIPFAINTEFRNLQYANDFVHVRPGDWVLDCGACWGDTSLWFADQVGASGRVISFEFIPSSLEIYNANLEMNPELSERIELVTHPVADCSGKLIRCHDNGAASTFKIELSEDQNGPLVEAKTISIDDWVENRNPEKVDFLKMDIEGAELDALYGAQETLKRFRPRLGIALYHQPEDIYRIPEFLMSLDLGYRFYLKHPTAEGFETVLLALCD
jgi:FkbM family methyltransferase